MFYREKSGNPAEDEDVGIIKLIWFSVSLKLLANLDAKTRY
jgi:hypothetical protein